MSDDVESLLRLISRTQRLESFPRTGWMASGVQNPESIAAHCWEVAVVALWLGDRVDEEVDRGELLTIALLHDVGEAMLTDLPKPVKNYLGGGPVDLAERQAADEVLGEAESYWMEAVDAYRERDTVEARLVKAADRIQMFAKALQYHNQQRGDLERFFEGKAWEEDFGFPVVGRILEALQQRWEADEWFAGDFD